MTQYTKTKKDKLYSESGDGVNGTGAMPAKHEDVGSSGSGISPTTYDSGKTINLKDWIIPGAAALTGAFTGLAAAKIIGTENFADAATVGLIGIAAMFTSYVVNDKSIEIGSELAARGFKLAGLASVAPIIIVGGAAAVFSYTGISQSKVERLDHQDHGRKLSVYAEHVNEYAAQIIKFTPAIGGTARDLALHKICEKRSGCLSKGRGGTGPTYRVVASLSARAQEMVRQLAVNDNFRQKQLTQINKLVGEYQTITSDGELSAATRAQALARKSSQIRQNVSLLRESVPISLVRSYGAEMINGVDISGRPESTRNVNALLSRHGKSILSAVEGMKTDKSVTPSFPAKGGVSRALERLGDFWPTAVLVIAIEMLIPLSLWVFAYLSVVWRLYKEENTKSPGGRDAI